jgi:acyl-CoA synthetase (AMP-forming)/AMP-acid ligase II
MQLHEYLEFYGREAPTHPCVEMDGVALDYQTANARANRMAHAFVGLGLKRGDRLAWLSKNCIDQMLLFFAASKVGVVPVPLNYRLAPAEWRYIINDCQATALVCEAELCAGIDTVRADLERIEHFVSLGEAEDSWLDFEQWIGDEPDHNPNQQSSSQDELYQMYTSGTTGLPKGAILTQGAIFNNIRMVSALAEAVVLETRCLVSLPLYHAAAGITVMNTVSHGGSVLLHREFDPVAVIEDLDSREITNLTLVPAQIQACLVQVPDIAKREYPGLRAVLYGASPIAEETLRQAMAAFDCDFIQVFGMTETTACATILSAETHRRALAGEPRLLLSCGRAALGTEVRIVNEQGEEVPPGTVGEISVRGPQLMKGYWNLPEASAKTLRDGWLYTGDAAKMDEEGFFYIQDRIKDMIVSGGENIYPKEIENALFEHPDVVDAAVIGIPSERWGETVLAFLVSRDGGALEEDEIIAFCRERLAGFKLPQQVVMIDEVPRNASGKALKKDLREPYWAGIERRVG